MPRLAFVLCLFTWAVSSFAQNAPPSDPVAVSLAQKSIAALTGGTAVTDATLNATVTSYSTSDPDTGTATLLAKGLTESRIDLNLSSGSRSDTRNGSSSVPQGAWSVNNGNATHYSGQNCWSDAAWFFPVLTSLSGSDRSIVLSYVGQESRNAVLVQHLRAYRYQRPPMPTTFLQRWSATDFYLDANSYLPMAMRFSVYADNSIGLSIPVEIDFSNYQATSGGVVPMHIQRYVQGSLALDVVVTAVAINSGLPDSDFTFQ